MCFVIVCRCLALVPVRFTKWDLLAKCGVLRVEMSQVSVFARMRAHTHNDHLERIRALQLLHLSSYVLESTYCTGSCTGEQDAQPLASALPLSAPAPSFVVVGVTIAGCAPCPTQARPQPRIVDDVGPEQWDCVPVARMGTMWKTLIPLSCRL